MRKMAAPTKKHEILILLLFSAFSGYNQESNADDGPQNNKEDRWHPQWHSRENFPDQPLQLVRPGQDHKTLEVVEENFKMLQRIEGSVATVAVVGKFHTGKSFLLNQLMGKSNGFGVGPYVTPQTMGIWMWGKPLEITKEDGQKLSLIFLDTEGFAANNVSENYDAKVFAVATLLSSYLVYNSVKIIDQSDIDYLELLARRTQLFALGAQLSKTKWTDDFNHDLLSFPPLLWVVQDFFQVTENKESPKEWLHRLMETHTRENEEYEISLKGIFKSVDCHTMFLPATKKQLLIDLSKAAEDELTQEYKEERDALREKIKSGIQPKEKNDRAITGPELASLLEILVSAANEGSLASIPSRWDAFIQRLQDGALEDCTRFYEGEMQVLSEMYNNGPVHPKAQEEWHEQVFNKSLHLLEQLLFGLGDRVTEASKELDHNIRHKFEKSKDMNEKRIKLKCSELQHKVELDAEEALSKMKLPLKTSELEHQIGVLHEKSLSQFTESIKNFTLEADRADIIKRLGSSITSIGDRFFLKNKQALEKTLHEGIEKAIGQFKKLTENKDRFPRAPKEMSHVLIFANEAAEKVFHTECDKASEEDLYKVYQGNLKNQLVEVSKALEKENDEYLHTQINVRVRELLSLFTDSTDATIMPLPVNDTDLEERLYQETKNCETSYRDEFDEFSTFKSFAEGMIELQRGIHKICGKRRQENVEAFAREVEAPLRTAKQLIVLSADKYDTVFSVSQFIRKVCLLNLDEGKPKHWPLDLKSSIIDHFMESDQDIQTIMLEKQGLWSSIVGFVQWIMWLLGLNS
ncbi:guanylate-binding protein 2 [Lingula anatina]|uniref:Guanylate-binding protein 2 n=1 Tax=Lingula anatina TaxID=7574 RepID=A0A1S3HS29_LINAN|nr:guanylate-binding protein 2 [Lingula anatina]|eukprot:XP_013388840.1 guanylate-binding protein 2 [Lingula anatina]